MKRAFLGKQVFLKYLCAWRCRQVLRDSTSTKSRTYQQKLSFLIFIFDSITSSRKLRWSSSISAAGFLSMCNAFVILVQLFLGLCGDSGQWRHLSKLTIQKRLFSTLTNLEKFVVSILCTAYRQLLPWAYARSRERWELL